MPRLFSVNVGLPRDLTWNGKTVRTSVWKSPVDGRRMVRKLDIDGDAQADLAGHGGEQRAVFVYQMDSYHHWERFLGRRAFAFGQFGETSPSRDFLITRCVSAIDTASVVLNLK
jgi:MOSC domain-containing protein YiiM